VPEDADSDEILDDVTAILDAAEQAFREDGWQLVLQTGNVLLGAKLLPEGAAEGRAACQAGQAMAEALIQTLEARDTLQAEVHVNVSAHVDHATVKDGPGPKEIVGGDLTAVGAWAPSDSVTGLHLTSAFVAALAT